MSAMGVPSMSPEAYAAQVQASHPVVAVQAVEEDREGR